MNHATILNASNGITFRVRMVFAGDKYGLRNCLTHDKAEPLVEVYDTRYNFWCDPAGEVMGQFVSRYYASTFLAASSAGLNLYGGESDWRLDAGAMTKAQSLVSGWIATK